MEGNEGQIYEFGEFRLDISERVLVRGSEAVPLTPKVFDLLVVLVQNHGHLLTKDEIISSLWADSFVEEANLNVNMSALRRSLGETPGEQRFIETVPRRGYRFVADVIERDGSPDSPVSPDLGPQESALPAGILNRKILVSTLTFILLFVAFSIWRYVRPSQNVSEIRSIAVLPFRPLTKSGGDAALEMGMADALITKLSVLRHITVRPTGSILKFSDSESDSVAAGRELQVEAVLEGRIQRFENRIRVTVQLLRVSDGTSLWAESFDDYFTNIFAVQDSISERMAASLTSKLSQEEKEKLAKRYTESTEAYELFLLGRFQHELITKDGSINALKYYRAAVEKDPEYALVYSWMTGAFAHLVNLNIDRDENLKNARASAIKAVTLDPQLADAHEATGTIADAFDWNWTEAESEYRKAIDLDPKREGPHFAYSIFLSRFKRHDEALREINAARQINPVALYVQNQVVQTLVRARRYDDAINEARRSLEMKADNAFAYAHLTRIYLAKSMHAEAEVALNGYINSGGLKPEISRAIFNIRTGKRVEGEQALREIIADYKEGDNCSIIASHYTALGEADRAFEFLEKAFTRRERALITINVDSEWDALHGDPRYENLVQRIGIPK